MFVSGCWAGVSREENCEVGVPMGSGVSDDGGRGDCGLEGLDRKTPLRERIPSQDFRTCCLEEGKMIW